MSFGSLVEAAVFAGVFESGPWMSDAPVKIAAAHQQAERRAPIVEAVAARFGDQLHAPLDRDRQQWFTDGSPWLESIAPLFGSLSEVCGAGEFPIAGSWTATDPPPEEAMVEMVGARESETGPITRWDLPVRPAARVFEIHRPTDWARFATAHSRPADPHPGWELPGVNQHHSEIAPLLDSIDQQAARGSVRQHLVPDWRSVSNRYDRIRLSWAGFITSEGCVVDLGNGDVTMLHYWFSERTLWLADVFGEPASAPDPQINFAGNHRPPFPPPRTTVNPDLIARLLGRRNGRLKRRTRRPHTQIDPLRYPPPGDTASLPALPRAPAARTRRAHALSGIAIAGQLRRSAHNGSAVTRPPSSSGHSGTAQAWCSVIQGVASSGAELVLRCGAARHRVEAPAPSAPLEVGQNAPMPFLKSVEIRAAEDDFGRGHPFDVPAIASMVTKRSVLRFDRGMTVFVGDNGSGKSTLLEAVAVHQGLNAESGARVCNSAPPTAASRACTRACSPARPDHVAH